MTKIEKYIDLMKCILDNYAVKFDSKRDGKTFIEGVKDYYCFESEVGWNIMMNAYYVFEDTELAKKSFCEFGLQGPCKICDIGERYLRLNGLLNAIYQQRNAVINLIEIHKLEHKKALIKLLTSTGLVELRNKIAAHSSNYVDNIKNSSRKFDVYEISRIDLEDDRIKLLKNQDVFEEYDLESTLSEFNKIIENVLSEVCAKILETRFRNKGIMYNKYLEVKEEKIQIGNKTIQFK